METVSQTKPKRIVRPKVLAHHFSNAAICSVPEAHAHFQSWTVRHNTDNRRLGYALPLD